jgi:hypothetical protein
MAINRIPVLVAVGFLLSTSVPCAFAQSTPDLRTSLDERGSVPPVLQWFSCVHQLEQKPYNKPKAQQCLDSIRSNPEIENGKITLKRDHLTFHVESPTLIVSDVDLGVSAGDLAKVYDLLDIYGNALRIGEPYESRREAASWLVLDMLLLSQGRRSGVTRTLHLDYNKKTARAIFKIWEGPPGEPQSLVPPYGAPCPILNANFNWSDADDFTPVDFIQRQMKTKWLGCFSEADLREDRARLDGMTFLKESKISVGGSGNSRDVSFHFRSNPMRIAKVTVHGYGLLSGLYNQDVASLAVHPGDTYSRSRAWEQENSLGKLYRKDGWQLKTFTDVQVDSKGEATLDFSILAYPDDVVYVNDKPYDVTLHREE